jgi:signal transduction histidine kinase
MAVTPRHLEQRSLESALNALEGFLAATQAIATELDLDSVLQVIVDRARTLGDARFAALGTVDEQGGIDRFITSGLSQAERERIGALPRGHGLLGLIIREQRSFRIADIARDPRRYGFPPNHPEMHTFLGVPVVVKGRPMGNLYLTEKRGGGHFNEADQRLVEAFALHAAIAIENARLHEQASRVAVLEERVRIGNDLHDGIIQSMYAVGLSLEDVPELMAEAPAEAALRVERAIEALHLTIRDVRNFIFGLQPKLLEGTSLISGLAALAEESRHNTLVEVEVRMPHGPPAEPDAATTADLLGIASEALSNVARHAQAARAWVEVVVDPAELTLIIADDGVGIKPGGAALGHQGLRNMRTRAERLGGTLDIHSEPGVGTRIVVHVPIESRGGEAA